jgi:hypothetical protein
MWATCFFNFQKTAQSKQSPKWQNSPNLVTLLAKKRFFVLQNKKKVLAEKFATQC